MDDAGGGAQGCLRSRMLGSPRPFHAGIGARPAAPPSLFSMPTSSVTFSLVCPLPFRDAVTAFECFAQAHPTHVPATSVPSVRSAARAAVQAEHLRYAYEPLTPAELDASDVSVILVDLPHYAELATNGEPQNDLVSRTRRFVRCLIGEHSGTRVRPGALPAAWRPFLNGPSPLSPLYLSLLARCCRWCGVADAPTRMPAKAQLLDASRALGIKDSTMRVAIEAYARALTEVRACHPESTFEVILSSPPPGATHFVVLPAAQARLREFGIEDPNSLSTPALLRSLAPELYADVEWSLTLGANRTISPKTKAARWNAAARLVGWLVRDGYIDDLPTLQLEDLLARLHGNVEITLNPRLARRRASEATSTTAEVSLLAHLAEQEAAPGVLRATTISDSFKDKAEDWPAMSPDQRLEHVKFPESLVNDLHHIWRLVADVCSQLAIQDPTAWLQQNARWTSLNKRLREQPIPPVEIVNTKDKARLIRTITLPQLVCVVFPLRVRELRHLRHLWQRARDVAAGKQHAEPDEHRVVMALRKLYLDQAVAFCWMALALDDGLRRRQYIFGRFGLAANFRPTFHRDAKGDPCALDSISTWWIGSQTAPEGLKISARDGQQAARSARTVRRGYVPFDILWDVLTIWRPEQLVACGAIPSVAEYDLTADMNAGEWALFPTAVEGSDQPARARTDMTQVVGREFHSCVKRFLRPELPEFDELGPEWNKLWAPHAFRLLNGSYHGGVLGDWDGACWLLQDEEQTIRDEYSTVANEIRDAIRGQLTHWEHPRAYDRWMRRLFEEQLEFDPLEDPLLPLPDHLREALTANPQYPRPRNTVITGIRAARPGQAPPANRGK